MRATWTTVALILALSPAGARPAPGATTVAPDAPAGPPGQDASSPPPGSPEDLALWKSGLDASSAVQVERGRATRLQVVLANLRYTERLQALADRGGEAGEGATALARKLAEAFAVQFGVLTARWPVDTYRVCSYPTMEFGSALASAKKTEPADVARHRAMLVGCVEQAQASANLMRQGNDALEAAMREAAAALGADASTASARRPGPPHGDDHGEEDDDDHGDDHGGRHRQAEREEHGGGRGATEARSEEGR